MKIDSEYKLKVSQDDLTSPRDNDNIGKFYINRTDAFTSFYNKYNEASESEINDLTINRDQYFIRKLFIANNSYSINFSICDDITDESGIIFIHKDNIKLEFGDDITDERLEEVFNLELDEFNHYLNGDIMYYQLFKKLSIKINDKIFINSEMIDNLHGLYSIEDVIDNIKANNPEVKKIDKFIGEYSDEAKAAFK